ncbi:hypothetical protein BTHE68_43920 [Burkholderia sp. THE68]|uniref:SDR family NAD(P)-dependent oxidoreductase n=1 Tax=Burkholderiaceae TaxID=119060 RepID=UPI0013162039|nr:MULTISPECIES: SDR family NAD(P)-dependent oxidoreductase [Burkholderiaceae]BBU30658.1 hypothetical protein BTHE68_43920 [Burkholderia sp. THE68]BCQ26518.1 hypothetical protein NK8_47020 [Caballeronia sp. NK8]
MQPTAVVVGVGSEEGLGAAVARRFARGGFHVLVGGRTIEKLERVVKSLGEGNGTPVVGTCVPMRSHTEGRMDC